MEECHAANDFLMLRDITGLSFCSSLHCLLPRLSAPNMATTAAHLTRDAEKAIDEQASAIHIPPDQAKALAPLQHHRNSLDRSGSANPANFKSKEGDDAGTAGERKEKGSTGDYLVCPCSKLRFPRGTDCCSLTAHLWIYRLARPTFVRDRHRSCCGQRRCIAFDDPGVRLINRFDRQLFLWTGRPAAIP